MVYRIELYWGGVEVTVSACLCVLWNFYTRVKALSRQCWIQEATVVVPSPRWVGSVVYTWHPDGWGPAVATQHVYAPVSPEHWVAYGGSHSLNLSLWPAPPWSQRGVKPAGKDHPPLHPTWKENQTNIWKYIQGLYFISRLNVVTNFQRFTGYVYYHSFYILISTYYIWQD